MAILQLPVYLAVIFGSNFMVALDKELLRQMKDQAKNANKSA